MKSDILPSQGANRCLTIAEKSKVIEFLFLS